MQHKGFQVQDSVVTHIRVPSAANANEGLNIERNTIEMVSLRTFRVDSARLAKPKKYRPVIKTVPNVPVNDTIAHPRFNITGNNFIICGDSGFFEPFNFEPFSPDVKLTTFNLLHKTANPAPDKLPLINPKSGLVLKPHQGAQHGFFNTDWMLGVIIFSLILFGWLRVGFSRFFQTAFKAAYNFYTARRIMEEANVTRNLVFYFMNLLFFVNLALFITQYFEYYHIVLFNAHGVLLFMLLLGVTIVLYSIKSFFLNALDFLFLTKGAFRSYVKTVFLYNKMVGFVLLPIVSGLPFVPGHIIPGLFYLGGLIIIILYIFRIFRGLQIGIKNRLSVFYLILYLCALEILPVLILFKVILSLFFI